MSTIRTNALSPLGSDLVVQVIDLVFGQVASVVDVTGSAVPSTVLYITTSGYNTKGDGGGATYKRVSAEPTHAGKFQTAGGVWWEFSGSEVNLYQVGCLGTSTSGSSGTGADDTAGFNRAISIASALRIPVKVPSLKAGLAFRLTSMITVAESVVVEGDGAMVTASGTTVNTPNGGSWLYLDHLGMGFYCRDDANVGASKKFARFRGLGIDRNQAVPAASWAPSSADYDVRVEFNVDFDDILFLKSSKIAHIRSAGQLQTRKVRAQPLIVGYYCERSSDVQRWDGDHFWPYWSQDTNVKAYTTVNSDCIQVQRADGLMLENTFGIWYRRLFYANDAAGAGSGLANFHMSNPYSDVGGGGIEIASNYYQAYGTISGYCCNSDVGGAPSEGAAFRLSGTVSSNIKLGMRCNRAPAEAVYVSGPHRVTLDATRIAGWSYVTANAYAIRATLGAIITLLGAPEFTTNNSLFYSQDSTSQIVLPVNFQLGHVATSAQGFNSRRVTIADDAVVVVPAPSTDFTCNLVLTPTSVPAAGNPAGTVWLRASSSPSAAVVALSHTANVSVTTGALTGTTGTDGNLTVSAAADGNYYIENRTGASRSFVLTILGN